MSQIAVHFLKQIFSRHKTFDIAFSSAECASKALPIVRGSEPLRVRLGIREGEAPAEPGFPSALRLGRSLALPYPSPAISSVPALVLLLFPIFLLAGCSQSPVANPPDQPAIVSLQKLSIEGSSGTRISSPHYQIYSTIDDGIILHRVARVMEGALAQYRAIAPDIPLTDHPMDCYLFESRNQWAAFTRAHAGEDAPIYLRVNRGGYTIGDWYVAYWIGDTSTYSVAAHEGWHQYVARHLKGRLPPFLEEGMACLFEQIEWDGDQPQWDLTRNASRMMSLRSAVIGNHLYPLAELVRMHAGQVVGKSNAQIESFYAESWAFARFLYSANRGRNRSAIQRMLGDAAAGRLFDDSSRQFADGPLWDSSTAKPMLEHYLGTTLEAIEPTFRQYMDQLVQSGDNL